MNEVRIYHEEPPCDKERLRKHINLLKDIMEPPLTGRVEIDFYAEKLAQSADVFYAMDGEHICGSCAVYLNGKKGYISSIGVFSNYWRRGIGTLLLNEVSRIAKEKHIDEIELKVYKSNEKAIRFYENNGFMSVVMEDDWIIMRLTSN